jgi:hypothetical protein
MLLCVCTLLCVVGSGHKWNDRVRLSTAFVVGQFEVLRTVLSQCIVNLVSETNAPERESIETPVFRVWEVSFSRIVCVCVCVCVCVYVCMCVCVRTCV